MKETILSLLSIYILKGPWILWPEFAQQILVVKIKLHFGTGTFESLNIFVISLQVNTYVLYHKCLQIAIIFTDNLHIDLINVLL